jgi:serine/threonine protein kinase
MGPPTDRWTAVRSLFHEAIDLPADRRQQVLASIPDLDLRAEVEQLLSTAEQLDGEFLGGPLLAGASVLAEHLVDRRLLGTVVKDRYQIEHFLGRGGQGTVWLGRDLQAERRVAIKVLNVAEEHAQWLRKRFAAEWGVLRMLQHPNIVWVCDYGDIDGLPFLVMEYVEGETLRRRLSSTLSLAAMACIVRQIGTALSMAHGLGICHCDLKPENVIVNEEMDIKLIDFGIAQGGRVETGTTVTLLIMAGTTRYMAPEQFLGVSSPKSDIYSLAVVIYEMLVGKCPYNADGAMEMARAHRQRTIRTILQETSEIPRRLVPLLMSALALDPDQRPDNAARFAGEVSEIILEPKLTVMRRVKQTATWLRRAVPVRVACLALLMGGMGWLWVPLWQEAHIVPVYETANARDPLTDGFRPHNDVSGTVNYNDSGTGYDAWIVFTGSQGHYHRTISDAQKRVAMESGWTFTMISKPLEGQAYVDVDFVGRGPLFVMSVAILKGKVVARAQNSVTPKWDFTDSELDLDPAAYHEYRMTYDPGSKTAQIAVDGTVVITGYRGMRQYQDNLGADFGCERFQSKRGQAAFKLVRFEIRGRSRGGS